MFSGLRQIKSIQTRSVEKREVVPITDVTIKIDNSKRVDNTAIPSRLTIVFVDDYDINSIHAIVQRKLKDDETKIPALKMLLVELIAKYSRPGTCNDKAKIEDEYARVDNQINSISDAYDRYMKSVEVPLQRYKIMGPKKRLHKFGEKMKEDVLTDVDEERIGIIIDYLEASSVFMNIDYVRRISEEFSCVNCGTCLEDVMAEDGIIICPKCCLSYPVSNSSSVSGDGEVIIVTSSGSNDYNDRDTFRRRLRDYQGKQNKIISSELYPDLDTYFKRLRLPISEVVKSMPLDNRGRRGIGTISMMMTALKDTGYSEYYDDVMLITHHYWGWSLPDLSNVEDKIMQHYDKTQSIYRTLPKSRSSSLSVALRLYLHLQLVGYPCSVDDFKIPGNRDSFEDQIMLWKNMVAGCNDPNIFYIPLE